MKTSLILPVLFAALRLAIAEGLPDPDAVFQHVLRVDISNAKGETQSHSLHLWAPAESLRLRGLVVLGETSLENPISRDPAVRAACERQDLGILFAKASVAALDLDTILPQLAEASGWEELPELPLFFVGHSAGGPAARAMAIRHAGRCFGLMQSRGGGPMGDPPFPEQIPSLMIVGQFDEFGGLMRTAEGVESAWEDPMRALVAHKRKFPANLSAMAVEPGAGHFSWSVHNARIFAMFLEKCAALGLEEADGKTKIRHIDPASGWRVPLNLRDPGHPSPAPVADYAGDAAEASWLFDRESAELFLAYHAGLGKRTSSWTGKIPIGWMPERGIISPKSNGSAMAPPSKPTRDPSPACPNKSAATPSFGPRPAKRPAMRKAMVRASAPWWVRWKPWTETGSACVPSPSRRWKVACAIPSSPTTRVTTASATPNASACCHVISRAWWPGERRPSASRRRRVCP